MSLIKIQRKTDWISWVTGLLLLLITFLASSYEAVAQENISPSLMVMMEEGVSLMDAGDYEAADRSYKRVLRNMDVLPADICFYFGKNSYFLDEYKQSINWLNKYIELKGTKGRFFDECVKYLDRSEMAFRLESEKNSTTVFSELSQSNDFDCGGKSLFQCPICKGDGVLLKPGKMNNIVYQTCPYCEGIGHITCEDYKKYLKGELTAND